MSAKRIEQEEKAMADAQLQRALSKRMNTLGAQDAKINKELHSLMLANDSFEELEIIDRSTEVDFWKCIDLQIEIYDLADKTW